LKTELNNVIIKYHDKLTLQSLIFKFKFAEIIAKDMITNEQIRDLSGRRDALRRYL